MINLEQKLDEFDVLNQNGNPSEEAIIRKTLKQVMADDSLQEIFAGGVDTMLYSKRLLKVALDKSSQLFLQSVDKLIQQG